MPSYAFIGRKAQHTTRTDGNALYADTAWSPSPTPIERGTADALAVYRATGQESGSINPLSIPLQASR